MLSVRGGPGPTWGVYAGVVTPYADYVPECEDGGTQGEIEGGSSFALRNLCATEDGLREQPIPGLSQSVMWSLLMLCTTSESFPIQVRRSVRQREALDAVGTRDELPIY